MKDLLFACIVCLIMVTAKSYADPHHPVTNNYTTNNTTELTEISEFSQVANYSQDRCSGIAIGQASASNQLDIGSDATQLSLGLGECSGDYASSMMVGMKINKKMGVSGNWATDGDINAFGVGLHIKLK